MGCHIFPNYASYAAWVRIAICHFMERNSMTSSHSVVLTCSLRWHDILLLVALCNVNFSPVHTCDLKRHKSVTRGASWGTIAFTSRFFTTQAQFTCGQVCWCCYCGWNNSQSLIKFIIIIIIIIILICHNFLSPLRRGSHVKLILY